MSRHKQHIFKVGYGVGECVNLPDSSGRESDYPRPIACTPELQAPTNGRPHSAKQQSCSGVPLYLSHAKGQNAICGRDADGYRASLIGKMEGPIGKLEGPIGKMDQSRAATDAR